MRLLASLFIIFNILFFTGCGEDKPSMDLIKKELSIDSEYYEYKNLKKLNGVQLNDREYKIIVSYDFVFKVDGDKIPPLKLQEVNVHLTDGIEDFNDLGFLAKMAASAMILAQAEELKKYKKNEVIKSFEEEYIFIKSENGWILNNS